MRDSKRITILLDKLKELWLLYPDLRFAQLLSVICEYPEFHGKDLFFFEEDIWLKAIQFAIDKTKKV